MWIIERYKKINWINVCFGCFLVDWPHFTMWSICHNTTLHLNLSYDSKHQAPRLDNKIHLVLTGRLYRSPSRCQPRPCLQEDCHWSGEGTTAIPSLGLEGRSARRSPAPRRSEALQNKKSIYTPVSEKLSE